MERRIYVKKFTGSEWKLSVNDDHVYTYDDNNNYVVITRQPDGTIVREDVKAWKSSPKANGK